jgi:hypothetical protein
MPFLLARITDESDLPDDYYRFVEQFAYWQGSLRFSTWVAYVVIDDLAMCTNGSNMY